MVDLSLSTGGHGLLAVICCDICWVKMKLIWNFPNFTQGGWVMIKKDKKGYKVVSEKGKNLGSGYKTRAAAEKRLRQVEYFKHKG
jgi:hypothetical protein